MPKNTLAAFFAAGSMGFLGGILSLLLTWLLFSDRLASEQEDYTSLCIMFGIFMDIITPFFYCTLFLLPIAAIEKAKMEERSFIALIKRYTPVLTLPFGILSAFIVLLPFEHASEKYSYLMCVINVFSTCSFSLWFFIKQIKST